MINRLYLIVIIVLGIWIFVVAFLRASFSLHQVTGGFSNETQWEFFKYNFFQIMPIFVGLPAVVMGWYFSRKRRHKFIALALSTFLICVLFMIVATGFYIIG